MVYETELSTSGLRLIETTNPIVLPVKTNVKVLVTSSDVLHS
jgi:heme/copper-type cytochrome/quinol oxidase subunit 2